MPIDRRDPPDAAELTFAEVALDDPGESTLADLFRRIANPGSTWDRYEVGEEFARGGMGRILAAVDTDLRRRVAMKVIDSRATSRSRGELLARFLEEAQVTGQLDHPGVVPVYDLGLDPSGHAFFTMRRIEGEDFKRIIERIHEPADEWNRTRGLNVVLKACETLAYAHDRGVIHRDLKPANIMVGPFGETYVMDWGVARVLNREETRDLRPKTDKTIRSDRGGAELTVDGAILGTPAYMPPEQAKGQLDAMGRHSDVYSVGAILYHLLAGHPPYLDEGSAPAAMVFSRVLTGPPARLENAPPELAAICEKAMARDANDRYADTGELADDLRAFLEGRVVAAHKTGAVAELTKWITRNKAVAASLAAALLLALAGLTTILRIKSNANTELAAKNTRLTEVASALRDAKQRTETEFNRAMTSVQQREQADELYDARQYDRAVRKYREALKIHPISERSKLGLAYSLVYTDTQKHLRASVAILTGMGGKTPPLTERKRLYGLGLAHRALSILLGRENNTKDAYGNAEAGLAAYQSARMVMAPVDLWLSSDILFGIAFCRVLLVTPSHPEKLARAIREVEERAADLKTHHQTWRKDPKTVRIAYQLTDADARRYETWLSTTARQEIAMRLALARACLRIGRNKDAVTQCDRVLGIDPDEPRARALRDRALGK